VGKHCIQVPIDIVFEARAVASYFNSRLSESHRQENQESCYDSKRSHLHKAPPLNEQAAKEWPGLIAAPSYSELREQAT
jgi:hypothetical protein